MTPSATLAELATLVGGELVGDGAARVFGVADVAEAGPDRITFISDPSYAKLLPASRAGGVLVPRDFPDTPMPAIRCPRVDRAVAQVLGFFAPPRSAPAVGVHPTAVVDASAVLGDDCAIGPRVVIGARCRLGDRCVVHAGAILSAGVSLGRECDIGPNAVILDDCILGDRVRLHACAVIGGDGFGYYFDEGRHHRVPHSGAVILEDDVEIGACSCVDRAKFGATRIGRGTKIDNLVQIAHNCRIGEHCILAGQAAMAGSSRLGAFTVVAARGGALDGVNVGRGVTVAACSVLCKDVPDGMTVLGFPAQNIADEKRERASLRRLPKLFEQVHQLIIRVQRLETSADDPTRGKV